MLYSCSSWGSKKPTPQNDKPLLKIVWTYCRSSYRVWFQKRRIWGSSKDYCEPQRMICFLPVQGHGDFAGWHPNLHWRGSLTSDGIRQKGFCRGIKQVQVGSIGKGDWISLLFSFSPLQLLVSFVVLSTVVSPGSTCPGCIDATRRGQSSRFCEKGWKGCFLMEKMLSEISNEISLYKKMKSPYLL